MRRWLKITLPLVTLWLVVGFASQAQAATVSGRASTVIEWFDTADEETAVPIYQYLNLNVSNIAEKGWYFRTYGRVSGDVNDEVDADSRLYYAYLEKRNLLKNLDLKLGRQFIVTTAGASMMDGLYLDYRQLGPVDVAIFGGGDATFYEGYHADDLIVGGEVSGRFLDRLDLAASYLQKWDQSDLSHELIGFDAELELGPVNVYNESQYSLLTEEMTYVLWGAVWRPGLDWSLRGEYLYSLPVFSSTSIYSVFAVDEYQEVMFEANYRLTEGLQLFGRVTQEIYESVDDATVFEAGLEKLRTERFSGYLIGTYRDDEDGQDLKGAKAHVAYLFTDKFEAGTGVHLDVLERVLGFIADDTGGDDTTSRRYWVDATVYLSNKMNVQGKLEYAESDLWDEYFRGRVRLNVLF